MDIERMRRALERHPRIKERCFSEDERAYCESRGKPVVHYALRFAAKEAVLKALGTGFAGVRFTDVEVVRDERGRPEPRLHGKAAEAAEELGVTEMHVSLSYTASTAVASAIALAPDPPSSVEEAPPSPQERILASFKEARTVLDEVEGTDTEAE